MRPRSCGGGCHIKPPKKRKCVTYECVIEGKLGRFKVYFNVGLSDRGSPLEIFIDMAKSGSDLRSFVNCWAMLFSIALQEGVTLNRLIHTFKGVTFEPAGKVTTPVDGITECASIPDLVAQILEKEFQEGSIDSPVIASVKKIPVS